MPSFRKPLRELDIHLQRIRAYDNLCRISGYMRDDGTFRWSKVVGIPRVVNGKIGYSGKK